jgi:urocanate hydratase
MMGIFRHVDAGYELAKTFARKHGVNIPSEKKPR